MSRPGGKRSAPCPSSWTLIAIAASTLLPRVAVARTDFPLQSEMPPYFVVDALSSPAGPDSARVEIHWEIPRESLAFRGEGEDCRAVYDVAIVFNKDKRQVAGDRRSRRVRCSDLPATVGAVSRGKESFVVPRGNYDVEITLSVPATRRSSLAKGKLEIGTENSPIQVSDLEFLRVTPEGTKPNPGHELATGESGHLARLTLRAPGAKPPQCRIRWALQDGRRARWGGGDSTFATAEEMTFDVPLAVDRLEPGSYRLEVEVSAGGDDVLVRRRADVKVQMTVAWLSTKKREAALLFEILGANDEANALRKAGGEEWLGVFQAFWDSRDPTPGTPTNELRDEVFARMESANISFDEPLRRPGWTTDRGRVLIRHGKPDNRIVREGDFNGAPAEIWEYFNPRRTFVFVDERAIGDFVLSSGLR
jgi:GWxTD domain-containing protein